MLASILIGKAVLDLLDLEAVAFGNMLEFCNIEVMDTETDRNRSGILQNTSDLYDVVLVDMIMRDTKGYQMMGTICDLPQSHTLLLILLLAMLKLSQTIYG